MRFLLLALPLLFMALPASAQLVVPLTTPDGRVGCTQGKTGIGRPADWRAVADPDGPDGWALVESEPDATDQRFPLCISEQASGRDFDATLRFKPVSGSRDQVAGFMFRAQSGPNKVFGYQSEVDGSTRNWSGGLYDEGRRKWFISPKKSDKESVAAFLRRAGKTFKRNDWNTYRITCKGNHIKIEVNGVVTTDITDDKDSSGVIGIQHHGEKGQTYKFRNLRIKEIK